MNKIYTRSALNEMLYDLLGHHHLVDQWWNSSNKAFDGKTPVAVYHSGEDGRRLVADYILTHTNYSW